MDFPENLFYTRDHKWLCWDGGAALIGITAFAVKEWGNLVYIDVEVGNKQYSAGDVFGAIRAAKTVSGLFLPVGGTILEVNPQVKRHPGLVNGDPYGHGWLIKINTSGAPYPGTLMHKEKYCRLIGMDT
jgi:glycine cleavage system H protein